MPPDGVLIIDKPAGLTSRQVVSRVSSVTGGAKAGHAGTLDPLATGVLVVCIGRATLLAGYLGGGSKHYEVEALLGTETDTYDLEGKVLHRRDAANVTASDIEEAMAGMTGEVSQAPPAFSAVKHDGRRLYSYARSGEEIPRLHRTVQIDSLLLAGLVDGDGGPVASIRVDCGPGTYVRSIVHDLGRRLGCGACVKALRRTRSGAFSLQDAVDLEDLQALGETAAASRAISIEEATRHMSGITLDDEAAEAVSMGKPLLEGEGLPEIPDGVFRVLDQEGRLIALFGPARPDDEGIAARAVRVLRPYLEGGRGEAA